MKKLVVLVILVVFSCKTISNKEEKEEKNAVASQYNKRETTITMRDGIKLHTTIYTPKDTTKTYPILLKRTPYSCKPYGAMYPETIIGPNKKMMQEGNIIVYQDVRGRWNSEGIYDNMRAYIPNKKGTQTDESSDTYDTIAWLVENVAHNNGNVGVWGISYPGFYATCSLLDAHPALKAVSPQACVGDFFFDDFHHNGAYFLSYWIATSVFGYMKDTATTTTWYNVPDIGTKDQYQFFLDEGPLSNLDRFYENNVFWEQLKEHPNYDAFWQSRNIVQHLENIKPATMIVGGWFDAEDLYGPLETYANIENRSSGYNILVMGPWSHGDWSRTKKRQAVGNVYFGEDISKFYQENVETLFFNHFLKENATSTIALPEAYVFDTGKNTWKTFDTWPPENTTKKVFQLGKNQRLTQNMTRELSFQEFVSDPKKPVPYSEDIKIVFTPRKYMTDDQRFAARRPDVLLFETQVLQEDITMAGSIMAQLKVATTGTDADWIVKGY